jgi:hypothetical protein
MKFEKIIKKEKGVSIKKVPGVKPLMISSTIHVSTERFRQLPVLTIKGFSL